MLPTLRQLEYLIAVADFGQFSEAARRCGVSQPALSKQIRELEDTLGVTLFERTRPRVLVTPAGEEIVARARRVLAGAHELVEAARASAAVRQGTLHLGVIPTVAPYGLPGLLAKLRARFPEVSFAIHELQTGPLLERLRAGDLDLGLLAHSFDGQGLDGVDLVVEPFVLVAPAGHALDAVGSVAPVELLGASLILMEDGHCLRDQAIEICADAGAPPPASVTAASVSTLVRMVESGLGATLLPASALRFELRPEYGLATRCFSASPPGRTLTLQWRASSPQGAWYREIGQRLRDHYLELNETVPEICGQRPCILPAGAGV
jgi:LysR family hydrogen peroxide-inducible transcriptional activator